MKKLLLTAACSIFLISSYSQSREDIKSQGTLEEQNKEYVRNYFSELGKTRSDDLAEFVERHFSPDFILHLPGEEIRGMEGLEKHYANSMAAFPDAVQTIQDVLAEGNKVAFRGVLKIVLPNAKELNVTFVGFWNIQNGKIVEWWSEYDALGMMQQLGMELQQKDSSL